MCCDVQTSYAVNMQIFTGKQGTTAEKNQGRRVVLDLTNSLKCGHGITTDKRGFSLTGTSRKNKTEIPTELLPVPAKKDFSSNFAFNGDLTCVFYVPKKEK